MQNLSSCNCTSGGKKKYFLTSKHSAQLCAECECYSYIASPFLGTLGVVLSMLLFIGVFVAGAVHGGIGVLFLLSFFVILIVTTRIVELVAMPIVRVNAVQLKALKEKGRKTALIFLFSVIVLSVLYVVKGKFWLYIH